MRVNSLNKFDALIIEPRLSIRKTMGTHFEIEALGEFKHQSISQIVNFQNDFLGIEKRRWQLTDNDRLMNYLRIDASAIFKFKISNTFKSEIGASIWNISNRENTINNYFRINEETTVNQFSRLSLGLTTNAVVRIYF